MSVFLSKWIYRRLPHLLIWHEIRIEYTGNNPVRDLHLFFCILTAKIRGEQRKPTDSPYRSRTDVFPIIFTLFGFIQIHTGRALPPTFKKCPAILQMVSLKEIASYLKITPVHMSRIRRKQSLDNKNKHRFRNLHS